MEKLNVLVADDELPARGELTYELQQMEGVEVVGECGNGKEVLAFLKKHPQVDLIFLDIEMPVMDGLTCAEKINRLGLGIPFVFATGYSQFALRAFDLEAFDYILKPYNEKRIARIIQRARDAKDFFHQKEREGEIVSSHDRISLQCGGKTVLVSPRKEIGIVSTEKSDGCFFYTTKGIFQSKMKLHEAEELLKNQGFLRTNKGYIVNLSMVYEIHRQDNGTLLLTVHHFEKEKVPVSRQYLKPFKEKMHLNNRHWGI